MSKSRNEKKPPAQPPPLPTTNDIIPGKFNENQWNSMIEQESNQDFILDIIDEIIDSSVQVIHDKYIQSQLQPYSVSAAKDLLLQIIESRFLEHDVGEVFPANDLTWLEDEEPVPCVTDSWSQGSVPVQRCESRPLSARTESRTLTQSHSETDSPDISPRTVEADKIENDDEPSNNHLESTQVCESDVPVSMDVVPTPPRTSRVLSPGRRKHIVKSTGKQTKRSTIKQFTKQNVEQDHENQRDNDDVDNPSQVKSMKPVHQIRTSRAPPGEQEVTYDEQGNIVAMMRLSVDKLPSHRIRPRYDILDPQTDILHTMSPQVLRKATKKDGTWGHFGSKQGQSLATDTKKTKETQSFRNPAMKSSISLDITVISNGEIVKPLPPPLADSMDISSGVVVREGQLVRKGPSLYSGCRQKSHADVLNLQPVGSVAKRQSISVSDVIGNTSPVIRQMRLPDPIPPIAHRG